MAESEEEASGGEEYEDVEPGSKIPCFLDLEAADRHDASLEADEEVATAEDMAFADCFEPS